MYIKYELYRTKNQELFNSGAIEWVLKTDKDLIEIDRRIFEVLTYHISELPEIKKYGTAYLGRTKIVGIEINDNDDLGGLDEIGFRGYMANSEVMPFPIDIIWNKDKTKDQVKSFVKIEPKENKEEQNG